MKYMVLGLYFTPDYSRVVLIQKDREPIETDDPNREKFAGKFNGVGGKYLPLEEDGQAAMVREFLEETGIHTTCPDWEHFATMREKDLWECGCYVATGKELPKQQPGETEKPYRVIIDHLADITCVRNLRWLIELARDRDERKKPALIEYGEPCPF